VSPKASRRLDDYYAWKQTYDAQREHEAVGYEPEGADFDRAANQPGQIGVPTLKKFLQQTAQPPHQPEPGELITRMAVTVRFDVDVVVWESVFGVRGWSPIRVDLAERIDALVRESFPPGVFATITTK
jgi:hypothetical protein